MMIFFFSIIWCVMGFKFSRQRSLKTQIINLFTVLYRSDIYMSRYSSKVTICLLVILKYCPITVPCLAITNLVVSFFLVCFTDERVDVLSHLDVDIFTASVVSILSTWYQKSWLQTDSYNLRKWLLYVTIKNIYWMEL